MKLINLTPHPINLVGVGEIKPSGVIARLEETTQKMGGVYVENVYIPLIKKKLGRIINLPTPEKYTIYVVSLPVAQAAHRPDVFAIGESIRDEKGNVVGAKSLATF